MQLHLLSAADFHLSHLFFRRFFPDFFQNLLRNGIKEIMTSAFFYLFRTIFLAQPALRLHDFFLQLSGGKKSTSLAADNDLLQMVGGCYRDPVFLIIFMGKFFNILIGGLRFLCEYHMNVMVVQKFRRMSLHTVCVKDRNQSASADALIIAENVQKLVPGAVNIYLRQFL